MRTPPKRRFDTNPFIRVLDGNIALVAPISPVVTYTRHIRHDEISKYGGAVEIIGDSSVHAERVEAFLEFFR